MPADTSLESKTAQPPGSGVSASSTSAAIDSDRPAESESDQSGGVWHYLQGLACRMFVLFGLYVLSIGPMYWKWYTSKFVGGSPYVAAFYEPLWTLAHALPWFGDWLDFYVQLWGEWRF